MLDGLIDVKSHNRIHTLLYKEIEEDEGGVPSFSHCPFDLKVPGFVAR